MMKIRSLVEFDGVLTFDKEYEVITSVRGKLGTYYIVASDKGNLVSLIDYECTPSFKEQSHVRWRKVLRAMGYRKYRQNKKGITYYRKYEQLADDVWVRVAYGWKVSGKIHRTSNKSMVKNINKLKEKYYEKA